MDPSEYIGTPHHNPEIKRRQRREYDDSLTDSKRERDRLVDGIRIALRELTDFEHRETRGAAYFRRGPDESRPPSQARLDRLREVLLHVDAAANSARRKL